jgi:SAM-dependent methyltransferase
VAALFPSRGLALDVGAGSGRDAAWLKSLDLDVVAVEPATGFRTRASGKHEGIRWLDDRLPSLDRVHGLAIAFDLIILSAVWQHVHPADRPRAFRKLVTLLRPGGVLALTLRSGPAPADRPMHSTSSGEIQGLARTLGMEVLKVEASEDQQGRDAVSWTTIALRLPDDGTGALPLIRGIVLGDEKSSTYKLGLLRAVARVAEQSPAAALPALGHDDAVEIPLGLVSLYWLRLYLPLVRAGLPQMPKNTGPDGLGFAKAGFRSLVQGGLDAIDLRVGAVFDQDRTSALTSAIGDAAATIATMPANFTRFPNSDNRVFDVARKRASAGRGEAGIDLEWLARWGHLRVPGHLWRALSRFGAWIEPMLVSEWARLTRSYAERMGLEVLPGFAEAMLEWREPARTTSIARLAAERMKGEGASLQCVWSGRILSSSRYDIDHCLPWTVWPCGDLWNLAPCDMKINQHEKRDRLPSAAILAESRQRIIDWWDRAYLSDAGLGPKFMREVFAALPVERGATTAEIHDALDWRRLRLLQDQRVPEWHRASVSDGG